MGYKLVCPECGDIDCCNEWKNHEVKIICKAKLTTQIKPKLMEGNKCQNQAKIQKE